MEQISCLLGGSFIWIGKSPLNIIQKSIFSFTSLIAAYSINIDQDTGASTGLALSLIYLASTRSRHFGILGHILQGGFCGQPTMHRWVYGSNDIIEDEEDDDSEDII